MVKKSSILSFNDFWMLLKQALSAFPKIWWRIAAVNILMVLTFLAGGAVFVWSGLSLPGVREGIENLFLNFQMGDDFDFSQFGLMLFLLIVSSKWLILFVLVFSFLGKIANFLMVKGYTQKKFRNPLQVYFIDSWKFFWRYVWIMIRVIWYILWPLLIVLAFFMISNVLFFTVLGDLAVSLKVPTFFLLGFIAFVLLVWRGVQVVFAQQVLIHFDKSVRKTFPATIKLIHGHWWLVLFALVGGIFLINLIRIPFFVLRAVYEEDSIFMISVIADFLLNFFILAPLLISFLYFLMLHFSKTKEIKP